jgi:hypothetical protein
MIKLLDLLETKMTPAQKKKRGKIYDKLVAGGMESDKAGAIVKSKEMAEATFTSKHDDNLKLKGGLKDLPDEVQAKIVKEGLGNEIGNKVYFRGDIGEKYPSSVGYYGIIEDITPARNYNMNAIYTVAVYDKNDNEVKTVRGDWTNFTNKTDNTLNEGDHEVSMAQASLKAIAQASLELSQKIGSLERNIPGWIQDHIAKAENYIEQAAQGFHELKHDE